MQQISTHMNVSACALIAVRFIAHHPILVVVSDCLSNRQRQMILDVLQLVRR